MRHRLSAAAPVAASWRLCYLHRGWANAQLLPKGAASPSQTLTSELYIPPSAETAPLYRTCLTNISVWEQEGWWGGWHKYMHVCVHVYAKKRGLCTRLLHVYWMPWCLMQYFACRAVASYAGKAWPSCGKAKWKSCSSSYLLANNYLLKNKLFIHLCWLARVFSISTLLCLPVHVFAFDGWGSSTLEPYSADKSLPFLAWKASCIKAITFEPCALRDGKTIRPVWVSRHSWIYEF